MNSKNIKKGVLPYVFLLLAMLAIFYVFNISNKKVNVLTYNEFITNLKLQKLLYYAQGCYLAKNNESLIKEDFLAWEHGPVIRKIYDKFRIFGANGIQYDEDYEDKIDEETKVLLKKVYNRFGQYTAWKLRDMTHQETPWKETKRNHVIDKKIIQNYFKENYSDI